MRSSSRPCASWRRSPIASQIAVLVATLLTACASSRPPSTAPSLTAPNVATADGGQESSPGAGVRADVVVRADLPGVSIDRRVLGTNVPAWLGPERLADPVFQRMTVESGVTLLRMPGGSWSNGYDWAACERAEEDGCYWTWAARPTDFVDFMQATGLPGMWTVSINATAHSAAAAVAFFNGSIDDRRVIGVDRHGVDWGTVGRWAELRIAGGNADPASISLWEVGNEVYGGKPGLGGEQCAKFGWEDVWTCDGTEYVRGDEAHDGYLDIRAAMVTVDPTIEVGAVGVADPASWSDWGSEVIESAGDALDFYSVHQYGFDESPGADEVLGRPASMWPAVIAGARSRLPADVPIAITEYNLVSSEAGDTDRAMTRAVNALYIADTIGQLVAGGVEIANQWNLANGTTESGTDYGMIDLADGSVFPQYIAMSTWGSAGDSLLTVEGGEELDDVRVYPTRRGDGSLAVVMINIDDRSASFELGFSGVGRATDLTLTSFRADALDADQLVVEPPVSLSTVAVPSVSVSLPPWSLNLLEVDVDG